MTGPSLSQVKSSEFYFLHIEPNHNSVIFGTFLVGQV